ncbi:MAG: methyltransferase domain-containing protein [Pyrinomonadaceae bacterium]
MLETSEPEIGVEQLSARIREGAARYRSGTRLFERHEPLPEYRPANSMTRPPSSATNLRLDAKAARLVLQPEFEPAANDEYHAHDLLKFHDRDFVENAYRAILKRAPDAPGFKKYIESLRAGQINKIDILARLRYSPEGAAKNVRIEGLRLPATIRRIYRLPVVGYLAQLILGILRLPAMLRSQQQFEAYAVAQQQQIADFINEAHAQSTHSLHTLAATQQQQQQTQDELRGGLAGLTQQTEASFSQLKQFSEAHFEQLKKHLEARHAEGNVRLRDQELRHRQSVESLSANLRDELQQLLQKQQETRTELTLQARRVALLLEEARGQLMNVSPSEKQRLQTLADEETHTLDALYVSLEDRLRGSRAEIIERLKVYPPMLKAAGIGSEEMPVVDIGCGRGEWLELLKAETLRAAGVDTNSIAIAQCRARGLEVVEADALAYLRALPDESVGAVTGFHLVEHLPLEVLMKLLDEIVRVIKPGGAVVFETPNPQNVLVGSCNFYFDPTHRNPLPSPVMHFLVESKGFARVEVINLHPSETVLVEGDSDLVKRFNEYFYGPMDYAVTGWKAGA